MKNAVIRTVVLIWVLTSAGIGLAVFFAGTTPPAPPSDPSESYLRDRAGRCVVGWRRKFTERGYTDDDAKVAAVLQCTEELQALQQQ